jgi:TolB-like protein
VRVDFRQRSDKHEKGHLALRAWRFLENELRLVCGDQTVPLTPKFAAVLRCLLRRKGELVSREALLAEVWSGSQVSPDLVREYIFDLRAALGDDAKRPSYIETVRGSGFRLFGDVALEQMAPNRSTRRRRVTVAMLRPEVFSEDVSWRRFADAMADDLITNLASFGDIAVTARHSAYCVQPGADLSAAARALDIDYLIESSIAVEGDRLRAQFQLIDGQTTAHAWARRMDRPVGAGIELSDEIAATVANWIGGWRGAVLLAEHSRVRHLSSERLGAYDHYVLACAAERVRDPEHARLGLWDLQRSLELDPDNARAWLLLVIMLTRPFYLFGEVVSGADRARADEAMAQAYAVDPQDPLVLAEVCSFRAREGDMGGAITALERAAEIGAKQAETLAVCANLYAMVAGDTKEAQRLIERAHHLNPTPKEWCRFTVARVAYFSGDFATCNSAAGPDPKLLPLAIFGTLGLAMQGRLDEAAQARKAMAARFPKFRFEDYAAEFPIVARNACAHYDEGVQRL